MSQRVLGSRLSTDVQRRDSQPDGVVVKANIRHQSYDMVSLIKLPLRNRNCRLQL